jgi:hypothetical protein
MKDLANSWATMLASRLTQQKLQELKSNANLLTSLHRA